MKNNIIIISVSTIFLIAAVLINVLPGNKNITVRKMTIYTSSYTNWNMVSEMQRSLIANEVHSALLDKDNNADIKLKYSAMTDENERKNYDFYLLGTDKMVAVTSGNYPDNAGSLNLNEMLDSKNKNIDENIVILSPCTYNWLVRYNYVDKSKVNFHVYLPKIISEDKSAIGIVFDSEIDNIKLYKPKGIFNNSYNKEILGDSLYLMIKKGTLNEKTIQALVDELRKYRQ